MLVVDVAAIWLVSRRKSFDLLFWFGVMVCVNVFGAVLAGFLGARFESGFEIVRLGTYGFFLHNFVLLLATALLWRRSRPWLAGVALTAALALSLVAADAFLIEPHWLEVTHRQIASPKIHRPIRIVVVADLQTDVIGPYERDVLRRVLQEKPDLILMAGDYLQTTVEKTPDLWKEFNAFLREIRFNAPLGVFGVQGNIDAMWRYDLAWLDVDITLAYTTQSFDLGDLYLTCLGMYDSFNTNLSIPAGPPGRFHLVLGHVPNFARGEIPADLLVAGHTHGGQVRLPFIGAIATKSRIPRSWAAGLTELPSGAKLLVSRGIGMERQDAPRLRFLCRPELTVIDLVPQK
jgi:uncharacterized protein